MHVPTDRGEIILSYLREAIPDHPSRMVRTQGLRGPVLYFVDHKETGEILHRIKVSYEFLADRASDARADLTRWNFTDLLQSVGKMEILITKRGLEVGS